MAKKKRGNGPRPTARLYPEFMHHANRVRCTKAKLKTMGLPGDLLADPVACKARGEAMLHELKQIEASLSAWEAEHPNWHRQMPWYEARERYKADKAAGLIHEPTWFEVLCHAEAGQLGREGQAPSHWAKGKNGLGGKRKAG